MIGIQRKSAKDEPSMNGVLPQPVRSFQGGALFHVRKPEGENMHSGSGNGASVKPGSTRQASLGPPGGSENDNRMLSSLVGM